MKSCNTLVARSMGYMGRVSQEETQFISPITIMGPREGTISSYHQSGMSSKDEYLAMKAARKQAMEIFA